MDHRTSFLYNTNGDIFAIQPQLPDNPALADVYVAATASDLGNAHEIVRQLNSRQENYEAESERNRELTDELNEAIEKLNKNQTNITQLKNEINNLKGV